MQRSPHVADDEASITFLSLDVRGKVRVKVQMYLLKK
jgi:hypothetical protein